MSEERREHSTPERPMHRRCGLWLALGLLLLVAQTGIAVHQETHLLAQSDVHCHYCALGDNLSGMPAPALSPPLLRSHTQVPLPAQTSLAATPALRGFLSRAPPSATHA